MNRRKFLSNSMAAAGGAMLAGEGLAMTPSISPQQVPGAVPANEADGA